MRIARDTDRGSNLYNAINIAQDLGIGVMDIAQALDTEAESVYAQPSKSSYQDVLQRLHDIHKRLQHLFNGDTQDMQAWIRTKRPQLDGATPLELLTSRRLEGIEILLGAMEHSLQ